MYAKVGKVAKGGQLFLPQVSAKFGPHMQCTICTLQCSYAWMLPPSPPGQQFVGQWLDSKPQWIQPLLLDGVRPSDEEGTAPTRFPLDSGLDAAGGRASSDLVPEDIQRLASEARAKAQSVRERKGGEGCSLHSDEIMEGG